MRKYLAVTVALAFLLFVAGAMAQAGSQSGQQGTMGTEQQSGQQAGQQGSMGADQQSSSASSQASSKTVEGCIAREATDFFLVPKDGNPILLQAGAHRCDG